MASFAIASDGPESLGERTFLKLLLGLGLIKRQLAEFHVAGDRKGDAGENHGDRRVDGARS